MPKLVWRVKLVAELEPGVATETELARIERGEEVGLAGFCQVSRQPVPAAQFLRRSATIRCLSLAEVTTVHARTLQ